MGSTLILLQKITEMFLLMGMGYLLVRRKMLTDQGTADIGKLLTTVVIPLILINNLWVERTAEKSRILLESTGISLVILAVSVAVSMLLFRRDGVSAFSSAFSNAGFIGIPLVTGVLGDDAVFYISTMIVLIGALQYTIGLVMITGDKALMKPEAILRNTVILSVAVGIGLYLLGIPKPALVSSLFGTIGSVNTPLAMILLGGYLAQTSWKQIFGVASNYLVSFVRLLLIPALCVAVLRYLPIGDADLKLALMITAACPAGSLGAIFARQYGKDFEKATGQVCISTILCLIGIPLITALCGIML